MPNESNAGRHDQCGNAARAYALEHGWSVLPLHAAVDGSCSCGRPKCSNPGKHPRTKHGYKDASTDVAIVDAWWSATPNANVGVATGSTTGLVVIDIDPRHGGDETLAGLIQQHGPLPDTMVAESGGGGTHYYFRHPGLKVTSRSNVLKGIDVRADGGYIVAPPSIHVSGRVYAWRTRCAPGDRELAALPDWLMAHLINPLRADAKAPTSVRTCLFKAATIYAQKASPAEPGHRNDAAFSLAGHLWAFREGRHATRLTFAQVLALVSLWNQRNAEPLDEAELKEVVRSAERNGTPREAHLVGDGESPAGKAKQADRLIALAAPAELFHSGDEAYASVSIGNHRETHRLASKAFRRWLSHQYFLAEGGAPNSQAMEDALGVLIGRALFEGPELPVAVRLAAHEGVIWLDLANDAWQAVRVDSTGWQVVQSLAVPVRFLRRRAMRPLPVPVGGGSLEDLRRFVNVRDDGDWASLLGWLVAAFRPSGPYAILRAEGEQGSAKSTLCRILRSLIDPNAAPLRAQPREVRDLAISANNGHVLAFDNISNIPTWLSDALCRLATGGGFGTRQLHTDLDEIVLDAVRPIMINGISGIASRPDLIDRCVRLDLEPIPEGRRRAETEIQAEFEEAAPGILGALLSAVSTAMRRLPSIKLKRLPRMADFALWVVAAEPALGLPEGAFLKAYMADRDAAQASVVEDSCVGRAVVKFVATVRYWTGISRELLLRIAEDTFSGIAERQGQDWPRAPQALSNELRRLAPALRAHGVDIQFAKKPQGRAKRAEIRLQYTGDESSASPASSANGDSDPARADSSRSSAEYSSQGSNGQSSASTPAGAPETRIAGDAEEAENPAAGVMDTTEGVEEYEV